MNELFNIIAIGDVVGKTWKNVLKEQAAGNKSRAIIYTTS